MTSQYSKVTNEQLKAIGRTTTEQTEARLKLGRATAPVYRKLRARLEEVIEIKPPQPVDYDRDLVMMTVAESQKLYLARKVKEEEELSKKELDALAGAGIITEDGPNDGGDAFSYDEKAV